MKEKYNVIPIFVPHEGCPHDCIFCNQKSISGQVEQVNAKTVKATTESYLDTLPEAYTEIAFYGGSFTGIEKEKQEELLKSAYEYVKRGKVNGIRVSTRPDYIDGDSLNLLKTYGVKTIELGVQSMDDDVLDKSFRGHTSEDVVKASQIIRDFGFELGHQVMIGLPGDTPEKDFFTARKIVGLKPDIIRIYPVLVIKNTGLEKLYCKGLYNPLDLMEAVEISREMLKLFKKNDINVIRIGLQVTENINIGKDVVAGPFHPAFKELVESELRYEMLEYMLEGFNPGEKENMTIKVNDREVSVTIGHNKCNIKKLYDKYGFKKIAVAGDNNKKEGCVLMDLDGHISKLEEKLFIYKTTNI